MKRNIKRIAAVLTLSAATATTGIFAYLTGSDQQQNIFTVGEVSIDLKEEKWDELQRSKDTNGDGKIDESDVPDEAMNMYPSQTIVKDPKVLNQGKNAAWIYLQVQVPKQKAIVADENGILLDGGNPIPAQLYIYMVNGIDEAGDWEFLASDLTADSENIYLYAVKQPVDPGKETGTLFDEISFINVVEGQINSDTPQNIMITAYAIQADNTGDNIDAWNKFLNQALGSDEGTIKIPAITKSDIPDPSQEHTDPAQDEPDTIPESGSPEDVNL